LLLHPAASDEEAKKARDAAWLPCSSSTPNEDSRERQVGGGGGGDGRGGRGGGGGGSLISMSTMPYGEDCNEISGIFFIKIQNMQSCDRIPYIHFLLSVFRLNFGHRFI